MITEGDSTTLRGKAHSPRATSCRTYIGVGSAADIGEAAIAVAADISDELDINRDARRHVAFGFGVHQCLGQSLARLELQVVYSTLYRRIPTLRLATGLDQIPFKHDGQVYGVYELPVTW
ncbi:cytochrome P450 [Sphaerisporangium sp. NPDC088356]|uniref:cytochrome P450 n=1 Tax=Sphaerisporangium sp. NPDC088356 TaxID=3154871 RepID=UPI003435DD63